MDIATKGLPASKIIRAAFLQIAIVFVLSFWALQSGSAESINQVLDKPVNQNYGNLSSGKQASPIVNVDLYIEIPSQRLVFHHALSIPAGYTVSQVLESAYSVKHGLVCCDSRDIWSINGLAVNPYKEKWWVIKVNGNKQNSSSQTKVYASDVIELIYEESSLYPADHVRLEDWVARAKP